MRDVELVNNMKVTVFPNYGILWLVFRTSCVATLAAMCLTLKAQAQAILEDRPHTHNMLVVGEKCLFLYHLPMFDLASNKRPTYTSQHRFQVILEATFTVGDESMDHIYTADRQKNPSTRIYTLKPSEFILSRLVAPGPQSSLLTSFQGTVFRGHLEKGGEAIAELDNIGVNIRRVVYFREFDASLTEKEKPSQLEYELFGKGQEIFLAHLITRPPDFDQILSVKIIGHSFTDQELGQGVRIVIPESKNQATLRIRENQDVVAEMPIIEGGSANSVKLRPTMELYFEEGELRSPPSFDPTDEERKAGFE
jgi:hypothetical protein